MKLAVWLAIALCTLQAATLSGLNLAVFSVSRLRLEVDAAGGSAPARKVLALRKNANYTLATIIWGNVAANVLLTLLSHRVLAGVLGFAFSTPEVGALEGTGDEAGEPRTVLDTHRFLSRALLGPGTATPREFAHRPIVVRDARTPLGNVLGRLRMRSGTTSGTAEDLLDEDVILLWGRRKRIITGADLLGRLLRGIAQR